MVVLESDMPYLYYVDNGVVFKMTVNQSVIQRVADVTTAAAAVTGIRTQSICAYLSLTQYRSSVISHVQWLKCHRTQGTQFSHVRFPKTRGNARVLHSGLILAYCAF